MEYLINILGFASLATILVDLLDTLDTEQKLPQKPFKCALCMGTWLSVLPLIGMYDLQGILMAGMSGVSAELIDRLLNK